MKLNLHNRTLRVGANVSPPFVFLRFDDETQTWHTAGGIEVKLLDTLAQYFNFTYSIINCYSIWGTKLPNNTWIGLIGMLNKQEADFGIGSPILNYERSQVTSYLYPHDINRITFMTKTPQIKPNLYLVLKPFDSAVWLAFFLSLLLCLLFDYLYCHIKCRCNDKVFLVSIYSLLRQQYHSPIASGAALALWLQHWRMATFVLTTAYAGCLYSFITIPTRATPINTVEQLYHAGISHQIIITGMINSGYIAAIKQSTIPMHKEIGKMIKYVTSKQAGFDIVLYSAEPHAFISSRDNLKYNQLIARKGLIYLPPNEEDSNFFYELTAWPISPTFQYAHHFNRVFLSSGLYKYWRKQEFHKIDRATKSEPTHSNYSLGHVQSFFYVYLIGIMLAILCLFGEILCHRSQVC